jgi:hypothetical protein
MIVRRLTLRIERTRQEVRLLTRVQNAVACMVEWMFSTTGTGSKPPMASYRESVQECFHPSSPSYSRTRSLVHAAHHWLHRSKVRGTLSQTSDSHSDFFDCLAVRDSFANAPNHHHRPHQTVLLIRRTSIQRL